MVRSCSELHSETGKVWDRLQACPLPTVSNTEFGMFSFVLSLPPVEYRIQKRETEFLIVVVYRKCSGFVLVRYLVRIFASPRSGLI